MKSNKTYILAAVFIVLAVLAYFLTADRGEKTATYKIKESQFFASDSASIDKLILEKNGKKITMSKIGADWKITEPVDYPIYKQFVVQALSSLKRYKIESKVSDNPANKDKFGFNDTVVAKVTVFQGGNQSGVILIGNTAPGAGQTFIKKADSDEIFLASEFARSYFVKENFVNDWREKVIISIPKGRIRSVEINSPSESYKLELDSTGRFFAGKDSINTGVADGIVNIFQSMNTQDYIDSTVILSKADNTIKINAEKVYELSFYKAGESTNIKYILKVSDINQLFLVDDNFMKMLFKPKKEVIITK